MQVPKSIWLLLALILWILISMLFLGMIGRQVDISHLDTSHTPHHMLSSDLSATRERSSPESASMYTSFLYSQEDIDNAPIIQALLRNADIFPALSTDKEESKNVSLSWPLVGWSTDFHISPIADIKGILTRYHIGKHSLLSFITLTIVP